MITSSDNNNGLMNGSTDNYVKSFLVYEATQIPRIV